MTPLRRRAALLKEIEAVLLPDATDATYMTLGFEAKPCSEVPGARCTTPEHWTPPPEAATREEVIVLTAAQVADLRYVDALRVTPPAASAAEARPEQTGEERCGYQYKYVAIGAPDLCDKLPGHPVHTGAWENNSHTFVPPTPGQRARKGEK